MGEPITTGLLIGGGLSALGAVGGSAIAANGADSVNKDTMQYNHNESMINRSWQEQMYGRQLADQQAMYKQQLADQRETYEKYQSPAAMGQSIARLGVNPASVFGKVSGGSMPAAVSAPAVPSIASGSAASVSGLLNPSASYAQGLQGITSQASQLLSSISDSKLKDAQTIHTLRMAYGQEFTNRILSISADVAAWQIPEKAKAEINDLIADAALKNANGKLTEAKLATEKIIQILHSNEANLKSQEILKLSIEVAHLDSLLNGQEQLQTEQVKTERAKQSESYQNVKESKARVVGIEFENSIKQIDSENAAATAQHKLSALREQLMKDANMSRQTRLAAEAECEKLDKLLKAYREHPNKAALDAALDNFNEHFPVIGGFIKAFK